MRPTRPNYTWSQYRVGPKRVMRWWMEQIGATQELLDLVDEKVEQAIEEQVFQYQLGTNEMLYGSAYGPWLPPKGFKGIAALL